MNMQKYTKGKKFAPAGPKKKVKERPIKLGTKIFYSNLQNSLRDRFYHIAIVSCPNNNYSEHANG